MPKKVTRTRVKKPKGMIVPAPLKRLLEKRGWYFPPTDEEIGQRLKAAQSSGGIFRIEPEVLKAMPNDDWELD